jgi:hypothetical protein
MNRQRGANCFHGIKSFCGVLDLIWIDRKADKMIRTKRRHDLTAGTVGKLERSQSLEHQYKVSGEHCQLHQQTMKCIKGSANS